MEGFLIMRMLPVAGSAVLALALAVACNKGGTSVSGPSEAAPQAGSSSGLTSASNDTYISEVDRKWWKQHVPKFSIEGTVVSVRGTNPWDFPVQQGHAREFWLKVFDKTQVPQTFIAQSGPFSIGAKESFSRSVDIGFGHCFVEAELRLDTEENQQNGGSPYLLFGFAFLDVPGCAAPRRPRPSPSPGCEILPLPEEGDLSTSGESTLPFCDLCDNIEGNQQEVPEGLVRSFDEESGAFICTEPNCEGEWIEQEPILILGEFGECAPVLTTSSEPPPSPSCSHSRLVTVVVNEVNSCTQEVREESRETRTDTQSCECPAIEPDTCFYNISGRNKEEKCEEEGGSGANWNDDANHCEIPFPGISEDGFNLTDGQSGPGCLNKND